MSPSLERFTQVSVTPNPTVDKINLQIESQINLGQVQLVISNSMGQTLLKTTAKIPAGQQHLQFDTASYSAGLYIINIYSDQGVLQTKFLKQ
ncbi:MAG: T9SS type A sorting domain-containing protein [Saprospiraceae bacterium]